MQTHRIAELSSPLGSDVLLFRSMTASEKLGQMFLFELELLSEDHNLALSESA